MPNADAIPTKPAAVSKSIKRIGLEKFYAGLIETIRWWKKWRIESPSDMDPEFGGDGEVEGSFMPPSHDSIPERTEVTTSIERIRLENSRFDSIDEMMEEVENNHPHESLLGMDAKFVFP
ncbi:hypothetical protein PSHT_08650 [Puccinia striiformis]|uniref:Uncharacterized protein n=1 Tax=Puccinia striiformis TaxID=27350 RepID=A0A2S4VMH5_9BASI|nr:hypothetical protein PSHT_08650 [Puccinia striiformis]